MPFLLTLWEKFNACSYSLVRSGLLVPGAGHDHLFGWLLPCHGLLAGLHLEIWMRDWYPDMRLHASSYAFAFSVVLNSGSGSGSDSDKWQRTALLAAVYHYTSTMIH